MNRPMLATIYSWLSIFGGLLLTLQGSLALARGGAPVAFAGHAFQGLIMLAAGLAILRCRPKAVPQRSPKTGQ
jgi:hypothetical protein